MSGRHLTEWFASGEPVSTTHSQVLLRWASAWMWCLWRLRFLKSYEWVESSWVVKKVVIQRTCYFEMSNVIVSSTYDAVILKMDLKRSLRFWENYSRITPLTLKSLHVRSVLIDTWELSAENLCFCAGYWEVHFWMGDIAKHSAWYNI